MTLNPWRKRLLALSLAVAAGALVAGCEDALEAGSGRSLRPIPNETLALMAKIGTTPPRRSSSAATSRKPSSKSGNEVGRSVRAAQDLSDVPLVGPARPQDPRRRPAGARGLLYDRARADEPNSNYYLSFNVGYPNAYDRALGRTGGAIMVHGVCSSAGCFSMTDAQIAEIYAIARERSTAASARSRCNPIPFRMTARISPSIGSIPTSPSGKR